MHRRLVGFRVLTLLAAPVAVAGSVALALGAASARVDSATAAELPPPLWLAPATLVPPAGAPLPSVTLGSRGHALATWVGWEAGGVYASYRAPGAPRWPTAVKLGLSAGQSDTALDAAGNALVVSPATSTSENGPAVAQYRAAASSMWQPPVRLSPPGVRVNRIQVAMDDAGDAVAVWETMGENRVEASYRPVRNGVWEPPVTLWASAVDGWRLALAGDGSALVVATVYLGPDASGREVVRAVEAATGLRGRWQPSKRVAEGIPRRSFDVSAAVGPGGHAVVAWSDTIGGNEVVRAASHTASGGWEQPESLSFHDGQASNPEVALDGSGNAFAIWDATVDVEASTRSAAGAWTRPIALSPPIRYSHLSLSANARGQALAAWEGLASPEHTQQLVQAALYTPDVGWQPATTLSSSGSQTRGRDLEAQLDSAGDGLIYWDAWDGTSPPWAPLLSVQVATLDAGGPFLHAAYPLTRPTIAGTPRVGRVLSCRPGRWGGDPPIAFRYRWQRGARPVASTVRYLIRRADNRTALRCRVTGSNFQGSATAISAAVRVRR